MYKQKGNIAETAVSLHLVKLGLPVFRELGDSISVDLITIINKRPVTIQVKYCELIGDIAKLSLKKTGPNGYVYFYTPEDFDLFALYINDTFDIVWINSKEAIMANTTSVSFRYQQPKNNQSANIHFVKDYLNIYAALT